jgi:hypothetical protein
MTTTENTKGIGFQINQHAFEIMALTRGILSLLENSEAPEDASAAQRLVLMSGAIADEIAHASEKLNWAEV